MLLHAKQQQRLAPKELGVDSNEREDMRRGEPHTSPSPSLAAVVVVNALDVNCSHLTLERK